MFDPTTLHGIIPPMCTPRNLDGSVDVASIKTLADFLIGGGVHGLFVLGSTGEFALLTDAQRRQVIEETVKAAAGRVPVLAGIMETSTVRSIEAGLRAKEAGAQAAVLSAPFYIRTSQSEIITHFRAVKEAVGLPLMAYDVPGAVGVKLEFDTVVQLAREGTIVGLKDSSGVTDNFRRLIIAMRDMPSFRIFTGSELIIDNCFEMGAAGSVPGLGNVFPEEYVKIYDLVKAGDIAGAAAVQDRLLACFYELISQGAPSYSFGSKALGGFKTGAKLRGGMATTVVGTPLQSFTPADEEAVAEVMRRHGYL